MPAAREALDVRERQLIPAIVPLLADSRFHVRKAALAALREFAPTDLRSHLGAIEAATVEETDVGLGATIRELARRVREASVSRGAGFLS